MYKNIRAGAISKADAKAIFEACEIDYEKYSFVPVDDFIIEQAKDVLEKYGSQGLRSLNSIQLSTAMHLKILPVYL